MKQLSGLDASFLFLETAEMPMHVGAMHVLELPANYKGDYAADVRRHIATRLPLVPVLCRRLEFLPLNLANPVWVDSPPDLDRHVISVKLPKNSSLATLRKHIGALHGKLLARDAPLWAFYVFEGLAPGPNKEKRYGLYTKVHHAAVDGQAAVALAQAIFDVTAQPRVIDAGKHAPAKQSFGLADMLRGALANQLKQYGSIVKALPGTVGALSQATRQGAGGLGNAISTWASAARDRAAALAPAPAGKVGQLGLAPRTRLNASIGAERAIGGLSLPMAELKALRRAHDASLNDIVLMVCSGALRRHFLAHGPMPRKSLVAAVPVSLRAAGDTSSNNQASITVVKLGTQVADPLKRLHYVREASAAMKATLGSVKSLMPTDFPSLGVPWLMSAASSLYGRAKLADRMPVVANVAVSNVPGPAFPLYLAGAKMLSNYPTSIIGHGLALNITVQSYDQWLDCGIVACPKALPDLDEFVQHMQQAFDELKALPATAEAVEKPPVAAPRKAVAKKVATPRKRAKPVPQATARTRASAPLKAPAAR